MLTCGRREREKRERDRRERERGERERERERDTHRDRETHTHTDRETERAMLTKKATHRRNSATSAAFEAFAIVRFRTMTVNMGKID